MADFSIQSAYGVDADDAAVSIVRAVKKGGKIHTEVLDVSDEVLSEMAEASRRGKAVVVCTVPAQDSFIRPIEAPFSSVKKAVSVFPSVLDVQLPFPLEECSYGFTGMHIEDGKAHAVAAAITNERLKERIQVLNDAGLDPEIMEQEALALWRHAQASGTKTSGQRIVLYVGRNRTVAVLGSERWPASAYGTKQSIQSDEGPEGLVQKMKQWMAGSLGGESLDDTRVLVCGPAADKAGALMDSLGIKAQNWGVADSPASFLASALAEGVFSRGEQSINLRDGESRHTNVSVLRGRAMNKLLTASVVSSLLLILIGFAATAIVRAHHDGLQNKLRDAAREISGVDGIPRGQEVFIANQYAEHSGDSYEMFNAWLNPAVHELFRELTAEAERLKMSLEAVSIQPGSILVRGRCEDWKDPETLASFLKDALWDTNLERRDAGSDERVAFTLRAKR